MFFYDKSRHFDVFGVDYGFRTQIWCRLRQDSLFEEGKRRNKTSNCIIFDCIIFDWSFLLFFFFSVWIHLVLVCVIGSRDKWLDCNVISIDCFV